MTMDYSKALGMCEELHEKAVRSFKDEVSLSTDEELDSFIKIITEEKDKRKRVKNQKLMDAFKKAWYDLKEAGIDISFIDKDYHEHYFISCFEDIEFH